MDIEEIKGAVSDIAAQAGGSEDEVDPEAAHFLEDRLMRQFILHVSQSGLGELSEMASEVLKTQDIRFPRWYA